MKKFTLTILSIFFTIITFAQLPEPNITIRTTSTKKFFAAAIDIVKKVYPDPKLELQINFALMAFGYPNFKSISETENMILCVYDIDTSPVFTLCVNVEEDAQIIDTLKNMPFEIFQQENWLILTLKNQENDLTKFAKSTLQKTNIKTSSFIEANIDNTAINYLSKNYLQLDDIESATIKAKRLKGYIDIKTSLYLKKDSKLCKVVNSIDRQKNVVEAKFIPQDANLTILSKLSIPEHIATFEDDIIDKLLPKDFVESFKSLQDKKISTFASITNFDKELSYLTVTNSQLTEEKLVDFAKSNSTITIETDVENVTITNEILNIFALKCLKTSYSNIENKNSYLTAYKGFSIASNRKDFISNTINEIENDFFRKSYKLQKYEKLNADIIAILNNKSFINSILKRINLEMNDDVIIQDTVALLNIGLGTIKIDLSVSVESLRYFSDIYRACNNN